MGSSNVNIRVFSVVRLLIQYFAWIIYLTKHVSILNCSSVLDNIHVSTLEAT